MYAPTQLCLVPEVLAWPIICFYWCRLPYGNGVHQCGSLHTTQCFSFVAPFLKSKASYHQISRMNKLKIEWMNQATFIPVMVDFPKDGLASHLLLLLLLLLLLFFLPVAFFVDVDLVAGTSSLTLCRRRRRRENLRMSRLSYVITFNLGSVQ